MAKLHILSGTEEGTVFDLVEDRVTVGRALDNMIPLSDGLVSAYQAVFIRDGSQYRVRDLNATNRTRVNGAPITEMTLQSGDLVRFGLVELRFESEAVPVRESAPPVPPERVYVSSAKPPKKSSHLKEVVGFLIGFVVMLLAVWFVAGKVVDRLVSAKRQEAKVTIPTLAKSDAGRSVVEVPAAPAPAMVDEPMETPVKPAVEPVPEPMMNPTPVPIPVESKPVTAPTPAPVVEPPVATASPAEEKPAEPATSSSRTAAELLNAKPGVFESVNVLVPPNQIDQAVFGRLKQLGIPAANLCSDAVFLRRAFLDVIGTVPTAEEAKAFLEDRNPNKRGALVDQLLERDEFADYWAMKWSDLLRVKSEFPINLWPNAVQAYHHWIRTCLKQNMPYDQFVREMLTANGSNFRVPQVNFYRAVQSKSAQGLAQAVALTFMGTRTDQWPKEKLDAMAAFFWQVGYKSTAEWKEEIVYFDPGKATNAIPVTVFPDGAPAKLGDGQDPREAFANWLITPQNQWFTRNIANRAWSWLLGRGIIQEPDDIRPGNPPSNPELLALLERELVANKYDLKSLYRLILKSRTYQLASVPRTNDPRAEANFAFYPVRRLGAEVLIDALNQITGTTESYSSQIPEPFTYIPQDQRAIALADASVTSSFLELFGRSSRDSGMESERNNRPTAAQQLHLLNSSHVQQKLEQSPKLRALFQSKTTGRAIAEGLYLAILSRYPTEEELKVVSGYNTTRLDKRRIGLDVAWALINTAEFECRH